MRKPGPSSVQSFGQRFIRTVNVNTNTNTATLQSVLKECATFLWN